MRPSLFPNAENANPPLGRVSPVSRVNNPMVPVVASIGVNFGAGLYSSLAIFFSVVVFCAGAAGAGAASVSSAIAASEGAAVLTEFVDALSLAFFISSPAKPAGLFEKPAGTSMSAKANSSKLRIINRNMNANLQDHFGQETIPKIA